MLRAGIVGLPNVGKSTLFNALTAQQSALAANYPFATIEPNIGVVSVPDERLKTINQFIDTEKIIPAALRVVDIAGIVRGASTGEGLGNKFLSHIREVDTIDTELMLADLETVSSSLDKAERTARSGDKDAAARAEVLRKAKAALEKGQPARTIDFTADEKKAAKSLEMITAKKELYVPNVDKSDIH